mgnify:CR=1 FL=1
MSRSQDNLAVNDFTDRSGAPAARRIYGEALLAAARRDPCIVALTADLSGPTETDIFRDALPNRFYQAGIAEANMVGMAGGMARCGCIPFVHTFSVFATRRTYDQVAMQVAYPGLNVKLVGFIPGVDTLLGVSHQAIDDVLTTGATASTLARLLKRAGAARVDVYCLARTPKPGD